MQLIAYVSYGGNCEEAFRYYENHLGGTIQTLMTYDAGPPEYEPPEGWKKKIMHARLVVGEAIIMGSDVLPEYFEKPQGVRVSIQIENPVEAERIFHALAVNGKVIMPIEKSFWAQRFGVVDDQFGTPWMVNCP